MHCAGLLARKMFLDLVVVPLALGKALPKEGLHRYEQTLKKFLPMNKLL